MNASIQLFAAIFISVAVSLAILRALSRPLIALLDRLCPDPQAAAFWFSYTRVMLVIAPLLVVLLVDLFAPAGGPLDSLRLTLVAELGGALIGLHSIGKRLGQFVRAPETGSAS
ncbi:MAG: hypothetical protein ACN6N0_12280 [Microvirgula sp.]